MRSGQADVQRGKRGDPTKSENYEDAPGYNSSYGDKGQWKQQYRQGYMAGYQRAIYGETSEEGMDRDRTARVATVNRSTPTTRATGADSMMGSETGRQMFSQ